jgi:small-conductance mechanosensitive channel
MSFQDVMIQIKDFLSTPLYTIGGTQGTVGTTLIVVVTILVTLWLGSLLRKAVMHAFERGGSMDPDAILPYARGAQLLVVVGGLLVAFNTMGFKLTAVFAAGGLFAVALGFAMKNIAENFVSGLIMRIEKSIKRGDVLKVEGQIVMVKDVGVRYTLAMNRDNEEILIPNSILVQSMVTNRTLRDPLVRLRAPVGVVYSSDMKLVRDTLEGLAAGLSWRARKKAPVVLLRGFGNSSVDFEVSVWIEDPWRSEQYTSKLNEAIWWGLKDAGLVIAFPQLDVHFDPGVTDSLQSLRRAG